MANEYRQEVHLSKAEYSVDFYDIHTTNHNAVQQSKAIQLNWVLPRLLNIYYIGLEAETAT